MDNTDWLKYGGTILASLLGGGAMGALLKNWFDNKKNRIPTIGIEQSINSVFAPAILIKPKITFTFEEKQFHFENLYIVETEIINDANIDYSCFDLKLTLSPFAKIVYVDCKGQDASHEIVVKDEIEFGKPSLMADFSLNPFNRKNSYNISLYVTCVGDKELTKSDIKYSSKIPSKFIEV